MQNGVKGVRGAVLVTRVSTGEQVRHGTSLAAQRELCQAKAEALGLPVVAEYEDAGISGGLLLMRAGMQAAIADIRAGRASHLVCATLDRFSRTVEHQHAIKREIEQAGGAVVFCDMDFDDTPEGDLNFAIQGGFKQYERQAIRARTMRGKRKRAESGQQPQRSRPAYGYHIITNAQVECGLYPPEMRGRYLISEEKAVVARRIFAYYHDGDGGLSKLALALNRDDVPTPGGGRSWREATLRVILMNPVYKGQPVSGRQKCSVDEGRLGEFHKLTGRPITRPEVRRLTDEADRVRLSAPPLVSAEVWDAVQERLARSRDEASGSPRQVRMLSGRTVCPHCGGKTGIKYQNANGKKYRYFLCAAQKDARYQFGDRPCRGDLYPADVVEQAVLDALREAWQAPEAVAAALAAFSEPEPGPAGAAKDQLAEIAASIEALKAEQGAVVRAQIAGIQAGASPDAYADAFAGIVARRSELEARRRRLLSEALPRKPKREPSPAQAQGAVSRAMAAAWRVLTSDEVPGVEKRDLLATIVEKVVCHKEGADVVFLPGVFGPLGEENGSQSTTIPSLYTTCIGISTQR